MLHSNAAKYRKKNLENKTKNVLENGCLIWTSLNLGIEWAFGMQEIYQMRNVFTVNVCVETFTRCLKPLFH